MRGTATALVCLLAIGCSSDDNNKDNDAAVDAATDVQQQGDGTEPGTDGTADTGQDTTEAFTLACAGITHCQGCCPSEDEACKTACEEAMSSDDQEAWVALQDCVKNSCTDDCKVDEQTCNECVDDKCGDERQACNWGSGTGTCMEGFESFGECAALITDGSGTAETCPSNPGLVCLQETLAELTPSAQKLLTSLGACVYGNCHEPCLVENDKEACTTCQETDCATQLAACKDE